MNVAFAKVLFQELVEFLLFVDGHGIDLGAEVGRGSRRKFDGVIPRLVFWKAFRLLLREDMSMFAIVGGDHFFEGFGRFGAMDLLGDLL